MSEASFAAHVLDHVAHALVATDPHGRIRFWSRAAARLFGHSAEEALGRSLDELTAPLGPPSTRAGAAGQAETIRRCRDGSLIYVLALEEALDGPDGGGAVHSFVDVTRIKIGRDATLLASRYRDLLASMPDAIVIVNGIGRIVFANHQAESLFGHAAESLIGRPIELLMPERYRATHDTHRIAYMAQSRTRPMGVGLELYGLRRDGVEFPVEISLSPLDTEQGPLVSAAIRDITERRKVELALQERNVELRRANEAKDRFLATMSHELRTPLNAVIGFTGLLLMKLPGPLTAEQEKQLGMVQASAKHLLSLINDLLDLAKIDSGNVQMQLAPIDTRPVVEDVVATLRPSAEERGLHLAMSLPEADLTLRSDRRALQQILLNLVNNAIKFTQAGSVSVLVAVEDRAGELLMVYSVADTGVGISADDQARLFLPFTQVGVASARGRGEGSGLGLYLSRKLAALLGGRLELQSEPGRGSRFSLLLPRTP